MLNEDGRIGTVICTRGVFDMLATSTTLVGVLTLVVGVATFILTEIDKRRRAIASVLRTWQADTIAYIVDDAGNTGIVFDEIKSKYLAAAHQRKEGRIPSNMLQDDEIRRTLFESQSKGVLSRMEDNRYASSRSENPAKIRE